MRVEYRRYFYVKKTLTVFRSICETMLISFCKSLRLRLTREMGVNAPLPAPLNVALMSVCM